MGTLVNTMRVKRLIKLYKKNRKENRPIIFTLDIAAAFDWMTREIILEAIEKRIKRCLERGWRTWASTWAYSSQILKNRKIMYDERDNMWFNMYWGVPQGGVLSPLFFILALDHILMNKENQLQTLLMRERY